MRYTILLLGMFVGCRSSAPDPDVPPPGPVATAAPVTVEEPASEAVPAPVEGFSSRPDLEQVLQRAADVPLVVAAQAAVLRERGGLRQAGLAPNPVLRMSVQQWDVDDLSDGPGRRWIRLYERFETGGKRGARKEVAEWRVREASANERWERFRVAEAAATAHQEAAVYQELVRIREQTLETQRELVGLKSAQVESGREMEAVLIPLHAELGELTVRLAQERAQERAALRRLEGVLALPTGSLEGVAGGLTLIDRVLPAIRNDEEWAEINPEIGALAAAEQAARTSVEHARTLAVPDVTIGLGYENRTETIQEPGQTFGLFFDIPLPVIDRNQGGVEAAEAEMRRNAALKEDRIARVSARHAEISELLVAFRRNRELYATRIVPARKRDFDLAEQGFGSGRLDRIALTEARLRLLKSRADLLGIEERLTVLVLEGLALLGLPPGQWRGGETS
jgi:cobalt-zinc-cadmium efflux system outer membrane protein